jgi:pyridoxal phosphate enzyme (YggS family)
MVRDNLHRVRERLEAAARRARRDPAGVTLIGITKTIAVERIGEAVAAGLMHLGENRVQEADAKIPALGGASSGITWHLVGHLQSNKARKAVELFDCIHSVDSVRLARMLGSEASGHPGLRGARRDILIQVDLGGEPTKFGLEPGLLDDLIHEAASLPSLRVRGLMTLPPMFDDPEGSRPFFRRLRELRDRLAGRGCDLPDLSMGMTNDFEVAIEEGATMVRVGRAIFGARQ